jgi:hypothetical protein
LEATNVPEEHVASIFNVEEYVKQETSVKSDGKRQLNFNGLHGAISEQLELFNM